MKGRAAVKAPRPFAFGAGGIVEDGSGGEALSGAGHAEIAGRDRSKSKNGRKKGTGTPSKFSQERADKFIKLLADSCNITLAAKTARWPISAVYRHRAKDASFRAAWEQALSIGYSRLEMMMLERALHGVEKTIVLKSGESKVMREYDDRVALALLRQHRDTVLAIEDRIDGDEYQEACERIIEKLARLRERELGPVETKSTPNRLKLIALALQASR